LREGGRERERRRAGRRRAFKGGTEENELENTNAGPVEEPGPRGRAEGAEGGGGEASRMQERRLPSYLMSRTAS
jgi:hypothetical protein